ncbi:ATP-binding protein [Pseudonocardia bannensis]|uniref:ATPase n=1 Tax=Pseudonocardia bannensis TaxID=630973 RepID=A0A848DHA9_9PSEU|nr:ATP-binding protein [Pseudonocardia bannensis]NMH91894.1 ATPase [Pseudonocardia bannensis]
MPGRDKRPEAASAEQPRERRRRGRALAGESGLPRYVPDIALRAIDGHLTRTGTQVMAWYRLAAQAWSFRSDSQREILIRQIASQLGELQGRWLHLRVTTRPYPVHMWAESFDHNALGRMPDVAGALGWDGFLEGEQRHLMGLSMSDKEVFLGIEVSGRSVLDRWVDMAAPILGRVAPAAVRAELAALESEINHLDVLVAGSGLDAVPATAEDIAWLMHRSCGLGLPAPRTLSAVPGGTGRWETEDLAAFTDGVDMYQEPYAPTVQVVGRLRSQTVRRNVAVLSVGLMEGLRIPEVDDPWMQHSDRLPFPVEWSARIYVRRPEDVTGELQRQMGKVRSQIRHYTHDHDLDPPMSLARQADRVLEIEDEVTSGLTQLNTRLYGWWRIAVAGRDEAEAITRAQQVLDVYRPKVQIEHPEAQYRYAREFIPGEPLASTAYRRRGSVTWAAAAVPAATASVGDRRGIMLGETCTATRRPVAWDPWLAQEVRRASGLTAVVGGLGSGKSFLTGLIVYKTLRAGARWTVLDPSGPLAELTRLPELAPFSRHINLLRADPGILNPYRVVAEPRPEHFADEEDPERAWRRERSLAAATRRRLILDVLTGLLPYDVSRLPHTRIVLLRAVREVGGAADRHPGQVIDALRRHARDGEEHSGVVADFLEERRELPQAALLFPDASREDPWHADRDYRLTVLTMQGMTLPRPGSPREEWTDGESLAVELLNLASWLTQRTIYDADRNLRKGVALDETHFLSQVPTGKVLIDRLARDSRKFNVRALFASQLAGDLLRVSGFASLVNAVFVGRTDDEEAQAEALRLLRVPTGVGYEQMLGTLSPRPRHDDRPDDTPRQFVFADGHGGVEKIRIDLEAPHLEHVREALDTNPDASRVSARGVPVAAGAAEVRAPDEPAAALGAGGRLDLDADGDLAPVNGRNGHHNGNRRPGAYGVGPRRDDEVLTGRGAVRAEPVPVVPMDAELLDDEELDLLGDLDDDLMDDLADGDPEPDPDGESGPAGPGSGGPGTGQSRPAGSEVGAAGEAGR